MGALVSEGGEGRSTYSSILVEWMAWTVMDRKTRFFFNFFDVKEVVEVNETSLKSFCASDGTD